MQAHGQAAVGLVLHQLVGAGVPDLDRPGPVLARRDLALERPVLERVVLDVHGQRLVPGADRDPLGHRPAGQRALALEPEVVVQPARRVALDDEDRRAAPAVAAREGLRRRRRVTLAPVLLQLAGHRDGRYPPPTGAAPRTTARGASARPARRRRPAPGRRARAARRRPLQHHVRIGQPAHRHVGGGPGPHAGQRQQPSPDGLPVLARIDDQRPRRQGRRQAAQGAGASARHRQVAGRGDRLRRGKEPGDPAVRLDKGSPSCSASRAARARAPARDTCWPRTARSASSAPSTAPGTRRPGLAATSGAERRVAPQQGVDGLGVGVQVEQPAAPLDRRRQVAQVVETQPAPHALAGRAHLHDAGPVGQPQRPPVALAVGLLDPGDRPGGQERHQPLAVEGPPYRQAQLQPAADRPAPAPVRGPWPAAASGYCA